MAKAPTKPDIVHDEPGATLPRHKPEYSDMCELCKPRLERGLRIAAFHKSLTEFGYSGLTLEGVAKSYDRAIDPETVLGPEDSIITRLIRSQLKEAGLV